MWVCEDVSARERKWRCEYVKMWRWADVKMRRCEDEQMWRWADVKMSRCEDEQMWRWADVKMRRCEDEKMWRWEGVREGVKMRRWDTDPHYWKNPALRRSREQKFSIVRKEKFKRHKQHTNDNANTFCYVHVRACVCACDFYVMCLCQEKNKTLFCANKVLRKHKPKNAAVNGKVWICREYTFCLRTRCRLCMRMRGPVQDGLYCGSLWNSAKTPTAFRSISGLALLSVIHNNLSYRLPIFETSATA